MEWKRTKKLLIYLAVAYWVMITVIYAVAGTQFRYLSVGSDTLSPSSTIGEMRDEVVLVQRMVVPADRLDSLELMTTAYCGINEGILHITLTDEAGAQVGHAQLPTSAVKPDQYTVFQLDAPLEGYRGQPLWLNITSKGFVPDNWLSFYYGNSISAGRYDITKQISEDDCFSWDGISGVGMLCARMNGIQYLNMYKTYWFIVVGLFLLCSAAVLYWWKGAQKGKNNPLVMTYIVYTRYGFLIRQLVSRDFKTKYKRSTLGMAWSFLNPLLTMGVQYVVFSTLFKNDIPNYSVYLLTGIVFMNFFSEAVSMCMTSITSNASLINKVYMPKYIYPLTRTISSLVNFLIALLPLLLVMLLNGLWPRPAMLLLVFDILCLLGFVFGVGLLLTTAMTFFQDTQFLWGVVSMMWMYLTPIFYPESIIPENFLTLYQMNPMYQYITFARTCIIEGLSPEPMAYLCCILPTVIMLVLGAWVFRKKQDQFVLYL